MESPKSEPNPQKWEGNSEMRRARNGNWMEINRIVKIWIWDLIRWAKRPRISETSKKMKEILESRIVKDEWKLIESSHSYLDVQKVNDSYKRRRIKNGIRKSKDYASLTQPPKAAKSIKI